MSDTFLTKEDQALIAKIAPRNIREKIANHRSFRTEEESRVTVKAGDFCPLGYLAYKAYGVTEVLVRASYTDDDDFDFQYISTNCGGSDDYAKAFIHLAQGKVGLEDYQRLLELFSEFINLVDQRIPPRDKLAFMREFFIGLTPDEEAEMLGMTLSSGETVSAFIGNLIADNKVVAEHVEVLA